MKRGFLLLILIALMISGCSHSVYINSVDKEPIINVVNNNINVTVDDCIKILNDSIAGENLDLIREDYEVSEYESCVIYKSLINNKLAIRFIKSDKDNTNIGIIQLILLNSYMNQEDEVIFKATEDDYNNAAEYYRIICNSVEPRFETGKFLKSYNKNGGIFYDDVLVFNYKENISLTDVDTEDINLYQVFSSKDLFKKYEDELWDDDNQYFRWRNCHSDTEQ